MSWRILVVEDRLTLLASLSRLLQDAGFQVTGTNCSPDALAILAHKPPPDLLLTDLLGVNGEAILDALGPTAPPVVIMSADPEETERVQAKYPDKIVRVLPKPFTEKELTAAINGVLCPKPSPDPQRPADTPAGGCP